MCSRGVALEEGWRKGGVFQLDAGLNAKVFLPLARSGQWV